MSGNVVLYLTDEWYMTRRREFNTYFDNYVYKINNVRESS